MTEDAKAPSASQASTGLSVGRVQMPLGAKRLVLIGSLCTLAGILVGRYNFGGLVLAAAGVSLVSLALSYRAGKTWFSRTSWLVTAAGALWTAATAGYWWLIAAAAEASSGPAENASLLYYLGMGALVVMLGGVLVAAMLRMPRTVRR